MMPWERPPARLYLLPLCSDTHVSGGSEGRRNPTDDAAAADGGPQTEVAGGEGSSAVGSACAIRGRGASPGRRGGPQPEADRRRCGTQDDPVGAIRGLDREPGTAADRARSRAAEKLAAANAHLQRSFDDHRERVEKRKYQEALRQGGLPAQAPTAAERIRALRSRIAEREAMSRRGAEDAVASRSAWPTVPAAGAAARGDGGGAVGDMPCRAEVRLHAAECIAEEPSKEDVKMHLLVVVKGEAVGDGGGGSAPSVDADAEAAARYEAWHSGAESSSEG